MKISLKLTFTTALLIHITSYALNPVQGLYGGLFIGGSHAPTTTVSYIYPTTQLLSTGRLTYSLFGDLGLNIGYRINQFRVEGEAFYNNNSYQSLTLNNQTILSPSKSSGLRLNGRTGTLALMFNGFYDVYFAGEQSNFIPHLGLGLGYANLRNNLKFYCNNVNVGTNTLTYNSSNNTCSMTPTNPVGPTSNIASHANTGAAQVILGFSYFMDDFATIGLDFKHFETRKVNPLNAAVQLNTLNIAFNCAFDFG